MTHNLQRTGWGTCNATELYLGGIRFELWQVYWQFSEIFVILRFFKQLPGYSIHRRRCL